MSTFHTGDIPTEALLTSQNVLIQGRAVNEEWVDGLRFTDSSILWMGCIDAPDHIYLGSTKSNEFGIAGTSKRR